MALDTEDKRRAILGIYHEADSSIGAEDRRQILGWYRFVSTSVGSVIILDAIIPCTSALVGTCAIAVNITNSVIRAISSMLGYAGGEPLFPTVGTVFDMDQEEYYLEIDL